MKSMGRLFENSNNAKIFPAGYVFIRALPAIDICEGFYGKMYGRFCSETDGGWQSGTGGIRGIFKISEYRNNRVFI